MPRSYYEFGYTTIATGEKTTFSVPDSSLDAAYNTVAVNEEVARAIRFGLRRLATITDVTATRVRDVSAVARDVITQDPP